MEDREAAADDGEPPKSADAEAPEEAAGEGDETEEGVEEDAGEKEVEEEGAEGETVDTAGPAFEEPDAPLYPDTPGVEGTEGPAEADDAAAEPVDGEDVYDGSVDEFTGPGATGPESDEEMPLAVHVEEMLKRLAVVAAVAGVVSLVLFPFAERVINLLWNSVLPAGETTRPRLYGVLELKLTELKVASLGGLIAALPVAVYETYQFMRPGLYPHERRYYLAAIPTSLVLALVGVSFAYFIVLPAVFLYFTTYTEGIAGIGFALGRTFNLILLLMGYMALVFQIPLFLMLAMMMGLVTREWLARRRLIFWGSFLGISFLFSPDPTGMAPIIVAATMIVLFEGTLLLTKWTRRGRSAARNRGT